jgi:very-short-patch-repair endonuclease
MIACVPLEEVVAAADCALGRRLISRRAWREAIADEPAERRRWLDELDPASGSLPESVTRFRLRRRGITLRTQVEFAKDLHVDFVIGTNLVIEVDGSQHASFEQYVIDRDRDARLSIMGKRCLRFTGRQVLEEWPLVVAAIEAAIARGDAE